MATGGEASMLDDPREYKGFLTCQGDGNRGLASLSGFHDSNPLIHSVSPLGPSAYLPPLPKYTSEIVEPLPSCVLANFMST